MAELKKLEIKAYSDEEFSSETGSPFTVLINPKTYKRTKKINYDTANDPGKAGKAIEFNSYDPEVFSIDFILDGTGVLSGSDKTVDELIDDLNDTVYTYSGDIHQPNFIGIAWGSLSFFGRLESLTVEYTLFKSSGTPLRAKVSLSLKSHISSAKEKKLAGRNSPDMTHIVTVKDGDTLPLLCYKIYKDSTFYLKVARVNNLLSFRDLEPGTKLLFPPIKKR